MKIAKFSRVNKNDILPFELIEDILDNLSELFERIKKGTPPKFSTKIINLCNSLIQSCEKDTAASIGTIFLDDKHPYSVKHSVDVASICEIIAKQMSYPKKERLMLLASAFTANIGMIELQDQLYYQKEKLTDEQKKKIYDHPKKSVELLRKFGVNNDEWLNAVLYHHEALDGSGYPCGLNGTEIPIFPKIITVGDQYCAAAAKSRAYRPPKSHENAFIDIYIDNGKCFDADVIRTCINSIGIYPPGSFVKLENDEIAVVIQSGENIHLPIICSVINEDGEPLSVPARRDCRDERFKIRYLITKEECPVKVNPHQLWGHN